MSTTTEQNGVLASAAFRSGPVAAALVAPAATWTVRTDVLIVGSGVAGLTVAAGLLGSGLSVQIVTKGALDAGSTRWAQGGIARATADLDDVSLHVRDTLVAGAGLSEPRVVRQLAGQGRQAVETLAARGAHFDIDADGLPAQTREGGHSRARIVHAGGDATGLEVQRALIAAVVGTPVLANTFLIDLERSAQGQVTGALVAQLDARGRVESVGRILARATVLATGGLGHVYASTTNPTAVTGDGMAAALRAGAVLRDLEFVQFHPTVFAGGGLHGQTLLISEAVRGEGAVLLDAAGLPIMTGVHPLADLAPRDVVATREAQVMAATGADHLYLDARHLGATTLEKRFPTILAACRAAGVDPVTQVIPVRPGQHYACGGVLADLYGRTTVAGLYAVGEVSATGVHGANRLASNSLLEGLVAGENLATLLRDDLPARREGSVSTPAQVGGGEERATITNAMQTQAGVLRDPAQLTQLAELLELVGPSAPQHASESTPGVEAWETANIHTLATALVAAAQLRAESRGAHRRTDVPEAMEQWAVHTDLQIDAVSGAAATLGCELTGVDL